MVFFFQAGAPFRIENAKFWHILAHLSQMYAVLVPLYRLKKVGGVQELTIYQVCWGGAEHTFVSKYVKFEDNYNIIYKYG